MHNLFIIWSDMNTTGIKIIDEQHRGVVSAINSLYLFMQYDKGEDIVVPTLNIIYQYTKIHFRTEESMLSRVEYPEFADHKKHHDAFVADLYKKIQCCPAKVR